MPTENQPGKHDAMHPTPHQHDSEVNKLSEKVLEGAAEESGKQAVSYAADPESGAQEHIDNVKGWWARTFPCCVAA